MTDPSPETSDAKKWRSSLRSPSPGRGQRSSRQDVTNVTFRSQSPSPSRSSQRKDIKRTLRSFSPSAERESFSNNGHEKPHTKRQTVANNLRKSLSNSLTADLSLSGKLNKSATELATIESEYIKNLQQQVYYLELEADYLREQARKATEMHPQMTQEAERMLTKLKEMQSEMDGMELELKRKESSIGIYSSEKDRLAEILQLEKENRQRDKKLLTEELVTMKKEKDRQERELLHKNEQILNAKDELERSAVALKNAEIKINTLRAQLEQRVEQHNLTQLALEEKRSELLTSEAQLREVEDRYISGANAARDQIIQDLREEVGLLHLKIKETEIGADKDRFLRDKISDDVASLLRENSTLNQQILELSKQLERERELRAVADQHHARSVGEVMALKEKLLENEILREELRSEQDKARQYLDQLTSEGIYSKKSDLQLSSLKSRLKEVEDMRSMSDSENAQLRKDKVLLVDHVAELHNKLDERDKEIQALKSRVNDIGTRLRSVDLQKSLELTQQSHNWEEFSRLADNMKSLSQSMMAQTTQSTHSPRRVAYQY